MRKELSQEEVKNELLIMLIWFHDFCEKNSLKYALSGGTALGAVRHKGFIPWDDDIDVVMPRPDYLRLQELMSDKKNEQNYELISWENGKADVPFAKIINKNIEIDQYLVVNDKYLWIDIFPVDGLPDDLEKAKRILNKVKKTKNQYARACAVYFDGKTKFRAILKIPFVAYAKFRGKKYYAQIMHDLGVNYKYDDSKFVAGICWSCGEGEILRKEQLETRDKVEFCGKQFYTFSDYDSYLKKMYGDYMVLPSKNNRPTHSYKAYKIFEDNRG